MLSLSLFLFFPLVSPELLGVLSYIAVFMAVIALFFSLPQQQAFSGEPKQ